MKRILAIMTALIVTLGAYAQFYSVNYDNKTVAAMVSAYGTEYAAETYYTKQVNDILDLYTTAEVAAAGIFASKYLDRKALTELGLWASSEENYYYRRIYNMVSAKIMPKIWAVAGLMLKSPHTAMYWGSYLLKVCEDTRSLCMQFESVVSNSRLSFQDIAFLELSPEVKALFKLSEAGSIDWPSFFDEFSNIGTHFTKENLKADIDQLYNMGVGLAGAGVNNFLGSIMGESTFDELIQGKIGTIADVALNAYDFYESLDHDMAGTLWGLVGGQENVAGLFNFSNYNLTNWVDDYAREGMGQYYTQRWYIYRRDYGSEVLCTYEPPTDDNSIVNGGEWTRFSTSDPDFYPNDSQREQILSNSERYAGWSRAKVEQMNNANDGYTYRLSRTLSSYIISKKGKQTKKAYAYSITVTRSWDNTETIYEDVFDSYTMDLTTFKGQLNARLSEFNDNEEGYSYRIGSDTKRYYQTTNEQKLQGSETVIISVTCHDGATLLEGSTQYKCSDCGSSVNNHTKSCAMKTTLGSEDTPVDMSELDEIGAEYNRQQAELQSRIDALEARSTELLAAIADTTNTMTQVAAYRQEYNQVQDQLSSAKKELKELQKKQTELDAARAEATEGEEYATDDYYRIPAIMEDCKTAFSLEWAGEGYWSGNSYIRQAKTSNINGTITFKATVSIARKPKYFLGIKIHRAIVQISWGLTAEYSDTEVVDVIDLDQNKTEAENTQLVNARIAQVATDFPSCDISTEYIKSAPAETENTDDTYHLLWSSDRLEIARAVDSKLTQIYADLVSLEKMMHYKRSIIDVLKDITPFVNDEQGRRFTTIEMARRRWLRNAANAHHSVEYSGKYDDEEDE